MFNKGLQDLVDLVDQSLTKISLALAGLIIMFLLVPRTRTASHFAAAIIGAIGACLTLQIYQNQGSVTEAVATGIAVGFGFSILNLLVLLRYISLMLMDDKELMDAIWQLLRKFLLGWLSFFVDTKGK